MIQRGKELAMFDRISYIVQKKTYKYVSVIQKRLKIFNKSSKLTRHLMIFLSFKQRKILFKSASRDPQGTEKSSL